jgi:thiol-disulfide isomerase/thioredoxin
MVERAITLFMILGLAGLVSVRPAAAQKPAHAKTVMPSEAWQALERAVRSAPPAKRSEVRVERATAFLARWETAPRPCRGMNRYRLAQLYLAAERYREARAWLAAAAADESIAEGYRRVARADYARAVLFDLRKMKEGEVREAVAFIESSLPAFASDDFRHLRGMALEILGQCHRSLGDRDGAITSWRLAARANPEITGTVASYAANLMLEGEPQLDDYASFRGRVTRLLAPFRTRVENALEAGVLDAGEAARARRALDACVRPFSLLGEPAPEWTLHHAYGKGRRLADYRGRVVLLDFWATWCVWCIRSFPALRRIQAEHESKGFTVVGVTTPSRTVWSARYEVDPDVEGTSEGAPLRLEAGASAEDVAAFRAEEKKVIGAFVRNHRLPWDVVLIDAKEPVDKYALSGWPHTVLIDRRGRIRWFERGALLEANEKKLAKLGSAIKQLLAEH